MFDINELRLVTSNEKKLNEYNSFSNTGKLQILKGKDLPEVESPDPSTVILYKSISAGDKTVVEDTSFVVDGADVGTNVRWLLDSISTYEGAKAEWIVKLAVNVNEEIHVYDGRIKGVITSGNVNEGFGFDPIFIPDGENKTLSVLSKEGRKDDFSARKIAFNNMLLNKEPIVYQIKDVPEWTGKYQQEEPKKIDNKKLKKYKP